MKAPPYLSAVALTVANLLLPELDTLVGVYRWARLNAGSWLNGRRMAVSTFEQA
jgi:hypothetical protein